MCISRVLVTARTRAFSRSMKGIFLFIVQAN
jgi:hypothetical protein